MHSASHLARQTIAASPALRTLVKSGPAQHVIATTRAARIAQPAGAFSARQFGDAGRCARYTIDDTTVHVRHRTRDVEIMVEIFGSRPIYEPPPEVSPLLDGPLRILDLGGNVGLFGAFAFQRFDVTELRSYEPDPANLTLLRATAAAFPQWTVVGAAAGVRPDTMPFLTGRFSETRSAREGETGSVMVPVRDVLSEPGCDLLKMDIESGEWPILADLRLQGFARVIVMEWHDLGCPVPGRAPETAARLLWERGYTNQLELPRDHDGNGVTWAWC
jgi:FkbM family methyltransferase